MFENGRGVIKNHKRAFGYFKKPCEENNSYGCAKLGVSYMLGQGVEKDYLKGIFFFKNLAVLKVALDVVNWLTCIKRV